MECAFVINARLAQNLTKYCNRRQSGCDPATGPLGVPCATWAWRQIFGSVLVVSRLTLPWCCVRAVERVSSSGWRSLVVCAHLSERRTSDLDISSGSGCPRDSHCDRSTCKSCACREDSCQVPLVLPCSAQEPAQCSSRILWSLWHRDRALNVVCFCKTLHLVVRLSPGHAGVWEAWSVCFAAC